MSDPGCEAIEARLVEALLARAEPDAADLAHARRCPACAAVLAGLRSLDRDLDGWAPEPPAALLTATWRRLQQALASPVPARRQLRRGLPVGFRRELARLLAAALVPLPLVLLWNVALLRVAEQLLAGLLPAPVLATLGIGYAVAAAGWLALLYGSLPFLAHRRVQRRPREVPS